MLTYIFTETESLKADIKCYLVLNATDLILSAIYNKFF